LREEPRYEVLTLEEVLGKFLSHDMMVRNPRILRTWFKVIYPMPSLERLPSKQQTRRRKESRARAYNRPIQA
jgi:hypothetical protein